MRSYGTYNIHRGAYKPRAVILGQISLIVVGLMLGASCAFYLCIKTMPLSDQTTVYLMRP